MKTLFKALAVAGVIGSMSFADPVQAQSNIERVYAYVTLSGEQMGDLMEEAGYSRTVTRDSVDDPMISSKTRESGLGFNVMFYGCNKTEFCTSIQFSWSGRGVSLDKINDVMAKRRFIKGYVDSSGSTILRMDVNIDGGVSGTNIQDSLQTWERLLPKALKELGL